ncbi:hypothetical protein Gorai_007748 [Gossypium raimondii]|uniref:Uncharacterized protein n=1 Tax=Gossypium raimondii TaxID=29730 RepID=A0A7J8Q8X2_GOSRA|nr:hypothetical protein [Gossypium raimondii]
MASSLSTTPSAAFASVAKTTTALPNSTNLQLSTVSFRFSSRLNLRFFSKIFLFFVVAMREAECKLVMSIV